MLMTILTEHHSPNFSASYDSKNDIIRLNNKSTNDFYYENLTDNLFIMIDDDTHEVIGAQVLYFIDNKEETLESINKITFDNLKEALLKALKVVKENNRT